jgi:hypothetical protein
MDDEPEEQPRRGFHSGRTLSPEGVARNLEQLRRGHRRWRERQRALPAAVAELKDLAQLRGALRNRHFEVALYDLGGFSLRQIAEAMGYADHKAVQRVLRRPDVTALIQRVREAQLERVIAGDFGVRAQAKASAPKVMKQIAALGEGAAVKDADKIAAGKVVLQVAGELVDQRVTHHFQHVIAGMTIEELRTLRARGEWPARYREIMDKLGMAQRPAIDAEVER